MCAIPLFHQHYGGDFHNFEYVFIFNERKLIEDEITEIRRTVA